MNIESKDFRSQYSHRLMPFLLAILTTVAAPHARAASPGDEVVIVYNSRVPESKTIAEHYAEKRSVPKDQIFGFELTTHPEVMRAEFRDKLQIPLAKKLEAAKLWRFDKTNGKGDSAPTEERIVESKIRYLVLCYGVPIRITPDADLKEPVDEKVRPEFRRNGAAVESELTLLPLIRQNLPLAGPVRNLFYAATNAASLHPTNGILIVSRLDGPSPEIARQLVDKALEAEQNGYWGRAYIDMRMINDPAFKLGDDWLLAAGDFCKAAGLETFVETNSSTFLASFPLSHIAFYAGWYSETVNGPFAQSTVEFMPGAFAYHLHSFSGANIRRTDANWTGPLLARGATCSMGCVDEPYLAGTPDMAVFASRFLLLNFSFGEAACSSQSAISWQTAVVGDPLYHPFAKPPRQIHEELEAKHSSLVEWSHLRVVNLNLARHATPLEMTSYLEEIKETKSSAVLSEKLADLYDQLGKPSSAVQFYENALKQKPSPQQSIRLRLTLGEKLVALNRDEDAFNNYRKFIEENKNYSEKVPIYRKLAALALKLGKMDEVAKWEGLVRLLSPQPK